MWQSVFKVIFLILFLASCGESKLDSIKRTNILNIGIIKSAPPLLDSNLNDEFTLNNLESTQNGIEISLAKVLAKDLLGSNAKVKIILLDSSEIKHYLESGKVDFILGVEQAHNESKILFSEPYLFESIVVVSRTKNQPNSILDLTNSPLIVLKNSNLSNYFKENYKDITLIEAESMNEAFNLLESKNANLVTLNSFALSFVKQKPNFIISLNNLGSKSLISIATLDKELLYWLNNEIKILQKEMFFVKSFQALSY